MLIESGHVAQSTRKTTKMENNYGILPNKLLLKSLFP